jgi:hypothetical protein
VPLAQQSTNQIEIMEPRIKENKDGIEIIYLVSVCSAYSVVQESESSTTEYTEKQGWPQKSTKGTKDLSIGE